MHTLSRFQWHLHQAFVNVGGLDLRAQDLWPATFFPLSPLCPHTYTHVHAHTVRPPTGDQHLWKPLATYISTVHKYAHKKKRVVDYCQTGIIMTMNSSLNTHTRWSLIESLIPCLSAEKIRTFFWTPLIDPAWVYSGYESCSLGVRS